MGLGPRRSRLRRDTCPVLHDLTFRGLSRADGRCIPSDLVIPPSRGNSRVLMRPGERLRQLARATAEVRAKCGAAYCSVGSNSRARGRTRITTARAGWRAGRRRRWRRNPSRSGSPNSDVRPSNEGRTSPTSSSTRSRRRVSCRISRGAGGMMRSSAPMSRRSTFGAAPRRTTRCVREAAEVNGVRELRSAGFDPLVAACSNGEAVPICDRTHRRLEKGQHDDTVREAMAASRVRAARVDADGFRTPETRLDSTRGPVVTRGVQRKGLILQCFRRVQAALASGWLPKNPALSLAMFRASPASIRISPGRNQAVDSSAHFVLW